MTDFTTTPGPFYVMRTALGSLAIRVEGQLDPIALVLQKNGEPNFADAAMLAAAPHMLDVLISIQGKLMTSKEPLNLEEINDAISQVFEKISAEADA